MLKIAILLCALLVCVGCSDIAGRQQAAEEARRQQTAEDLRTQGQSMHNDQNAAVPPAPGR
jgi:hypothetical protein